MTLAPGKVQAHAASGSWNRDLAQDVRDLRQRYKVDVLVSLMQDHELRTYHIEALEKTSQEAGVRLVRFPIDDMSVPESVEETRTMVGDVVDELARGKVVVTHCLGGLGRTGLITACVLVALGADAADAIRSVRAARPGTIENKRQEDFVRKFASGFTGTL